MRLVRFKREDEIDPATKISAIETFPISMEGVAAALSIAAAFEDADLTDCEGVIAHLLRFPAQQAQPLWNPEELEFSPDYAPKVIEDALTITADGAGVHVLTRGFGSKNGAPMPQVSYSEFNGGAVYDWALQMREITSPCLRPSMAAPPWRKFVEAAQRAKIETN